MRISLRTFLTMATFIAAAFGALLALRCDGARGLHALVVWGQLQRGRVFGRAAAWRVCDRRGSACPSGAGGGLQLCEQPLRQRQPRAVAGRGRPTRRPASRSSPPRSPNGGITAGEHQFGQQSVGRRGVLGRRRPGDSDGAPCAVARGPALSLRTSGSSSSVAPLRAVKTTARVFRSPGPSTSRFERPSGPSLNAPTGLWQQTGWVRGQWPLNFSGSSPSGMCGLNGTHQPGPGHWDDARRGMSPPGEQCSAPAVSDAINTASYGQGPMPLYIAGYDAAGLTASDTKTIYVDNSVPTLSLSGPTRRAEHRRDAVRDRERRWQPFGDRRDRVLGRRQSVSTGIRARARRCR